MEHQHVSHPAPHHERKVSPYRQRLCVRLQHLLGWPHCTQWPLDARHVSGSTHDVQPFITAFTVPVGHIIITMQRWIEPSPHEPPAPSRGPCACTAEAEPGPPVCLAGVAEAAPASMGWKFRRLYCGCIQGVETIEMW
eukprot:COSAG04_NODE_226_length_19492_cov_9.475790_15_plen_138_part_00